MLGYRAHFDVKHKQSVHDVALEQFAAWLREKGYDADALKKDHVVEVAVGVEATLIEVHGPDGSRSTRTQVVERKPEGAWTSALTVHIPTTEGVPATVLVDIHSPATDDSQHMATGIPRLARRLLDVLEARDASARLTDAPILVHIEDVDALARAISDPQRRGLLFVAGSTESLPLGAWRNYVGRLLRQTSGLASSYVLDADATRSLERLLGATHAVGPGTVRTFLPGVDPNSELDARRHRILSTTRIVNDRSQWLAGILGRRARENALEGELPLDIELVLDRINARADALLLEPITAASGLEPGHTTITEIPEQEVVATESVDTPVLGEVSVTRADEAYLAAASAIHQALGVSDPSPQEWARFAQLAIAGQQSLRSQEDVAARLEDLRTELGSIGHESRNLTRRLEDEQLEHAATYDSFIAADEELRRLRSLLLRTEQAEAVYVQPEAGADRIETPGSFVELVANLGDLPGIVFTGDPSITVRLDVHEPLGVWASKTWAVLLALSDYAVASASGRCDRDVHGYLLNLPDGCRGYSANKHAPNESEDVQKTPKFSEARLFPVPLAVEATGTVPMMAHFKIAQSGLISPRLHYYDDVRRTGKVYVGYIGPHRPTKRSH